MTNLSVEGVFHSLKEGTEKAVRQLFPIKGNTRTLDLLSVEIDDSKFSVDDIESQYQARTTGNTWGIPVRVRLVSPHLAFDTA